MSVSSPAHGPCRARPDRRSYKSRSFCRTVGPSKPTTSPREIFRSTPRTTCALVCLAESFGDQCIHQTRFRRLKLHFTVSLWRRVCVVVLLPPPSTLTLSSAPAKDQRFARYGSARRIVILGGATVVPVRTYSPLRRYRPTALRFRAVLHLSARQAPRRHAIHLRCP